MPTYEPTAAFWADWRRLRPEQRAAFIRARRLFLAGLDAEQFHPSLRVKRFQTRPGWYELTWGPDGRALWAYGRPPQGREGPHIVWLRVGTHKIFE
ncbi:hypothetical protein [Frankia sp. AgKG'84/4]|uniref:hypothetical protein n=1 Tax=Frankia sp. AgKG'84/4 TaxID=573490 RepID=UPI00200EE812|nr:hypothetical protein [Frankia sp. AgKG'84/4]MCL9793945.1 hypothetical protein [Frankia sp. AgKG'84/4]